ncbi:MAG: hypothetical protein HRO68_04690 [Nitrosopumilus sp.]|nr:hypothetical protein [Nitrosopumilus sp.]
MAKTNTKKILTISLAAIFGIAMIASPTGVDAMGSFLDVKKAKIVTDSSEFEKAKFSTKAQITTDGTGGAFGFGVISGAGLEAIAVTTTHGGVLDSIAQIDANDASFHNHYVALQNSTDADPLIGTGLCPGLEVRDITFQEPGDVDIDNKKANMEDVPYYFAGTHSLSGANISFLADENVVDAVSFTIAPVFNVGGGIDAVCINDVSSANNLQVKEKND